MSDTPQGPGWWQASDLRWYPPESAPAPEPPYPPIPQTWASPSPQSPPTTQPYASPYPAAPYGYPPAYAPGAVQPNNGLSIASMVTALVLLVSCLWPFGFIPAFMGHRARQQIRDSEGREKGEGMAQAGIIIGWIITGLFVVILAIVVIAAVAADDTATLAGRR